MKINKNLILFILIFFSFHNLFAIEPIKIKGIYAGMNANEGLIVLNNNGYRCIKSDFLSDYNCQKDDANIYIDIKNQKFLRIMFDSSSFGGFGKSVNEIVNGIKNSYKINKPYIGCIAGFDDCNTHFWKFSNKSILIVNTKNVAIPGSNSLHYWYDFRINEFDEIINNLKKENKELSFK
jgi:hypothetical protein|tara:strand:+ start:64 stop:600 length:537 start_codon:yes stop_codon:yes gene_type:complete